MSNESTHPHAIEQDDPHNHKHTATPERLDISDRFSAPIDRQIVAWLQIAPGSRVLDAGCGGGGMARLLAAPPRQLTTLEGCLHVAFVLPNGQWPRGCNELDPIGVNISQMRRV